MTITNHFLAGALIGLVVTQPELAVLLAYSSHFLLDAIPHYGHSVKSFKGGLQRLKNDRLDQIFVVISAVTYTAAIVFLILKHRYFLIVLGLVAISPDMFTTYSYWFYERKDRFMKGPLAVINLKFHGGIQYERVWGIYTEIIAFIGLSAALLLKI